MQRRLHSFLQDYIRRLDESQFGLAQLGLSQPAVSGDAETSNIQNSVEYTSLLGRAVPLVVHHGP